VIAGIRQSRELTLLLVWPASALVFLLWQKPLFDNHMPLLVGSAAPAAAVGLGLLARSAPRPLLFRAALALGIAAFSIHALIGPVPRETRASKHLVALVRATTSPRQLVIVSDYPTVLIQAKRDTPPDLVDISTVRLVTGYLTPDQVLRDAKDPKVAAVFAGPRLSQASLRRGLARLFPRRRLLADGVYYSRR
jgi:hypothetical protein